ncbi:cytochrome c oxidase subunit I [Pseudosulfitobacter pseudonitzschiae]|uniref:Cytochrome c oxidase subunit I n=1 Tax=Pseudosulfitobacter pseudonitzschiae TaxID=1402135 RepID=A0A221JVX4_9RHOB|nr:cytochrome c oxidase subunit I [Pseudosulfitobacter pseudonitzschiae]
MTSAALLGVLAWAATVLAREVNQRGHVMLARLALVLAPLCAAGAVWTAWFAVRDLDPVSHVYPAILWALMIWLVVHLAAGIIMQCYCLAGSLFGKVTPRYDADLRNVTLYWHFVALKTLVTAAVLGLVPGWLP